MSPFSGGACGKGGERERERDCCYCCKSMQFIGAFDRVILNLSTSCQCNVVHLHQDLASCDPFGASWPPTVLPVAMHREPLSTEAARRQVRRGGRPVVRQVAGGSLPPLRQERVRTGPVRGRPVERLDGYSGWDAVGGCVRSMGCRQERPGCKG